MLSNSDLFLESFLHAKHKVYGYKLLPLSLYHLSLLEKYAPSALSSNITKQDLMTAAAILSNKKEIKFKPLYSYFLFLYDFEKQKNLFQSYLDDYLSLPETLDAKEGDERNIPFSFALLMAGKLIKETGYLFDYVFYDMNVSAIFWLNSTFAFLESGESQILSDKDKMAIQAIESLKQ